MTTAYSRMLWIPLVALVLVAVHTPPVAGQGQSPRPEVMQMVEAFVAAVNGTDAAVDKFVKEFFTADYQKARSAEERQKWFQSIRAKHGKITVPRLRRTSPDTFVIVVSAEKGGEAEFSVTHDDKFKIAGLGVNQPGGE